MRVCVRVCVRAAVAPTEFFTLFNVAVPGLLGESPAFRRTFEGPILRGQDADATDAEVGGVAPCDGPTALCKPLVGGGEARWRSALCTHLVPPAHTHARGVA